MIIWLKKPPCIYQQELIKEISCDRCPGGGVRLKVFRCPLYGACTVAKKIARIQCCARCPSHKAAPPTQVVDKLQRLRDSRQVRCDDP